ncbi:MAG: PQQ-like beta-propeller repeat protein [Planctomycetes bacterium]|nr:PQQ-like beta-propeller repeat protein [Planctomycetota bacterium]
MKNRTSAAALFLSQCLMATLCHADWPQWRGAKLDGVSHETNLPTKWSKTDNVAWRFTMPGAGGSTPVIAGDRIFVTSVSGSDLLILCVSTAGKELWRKTIASGNKDVRGDEGNSASPSACTDGKHVWTVMANGSFGCFTLDGDEVYHFNLQDRYGPFNIAFGMTSTPVLDDGRLYFQFIHGEGNPDTREAMVVCLDAGSAKEIWKQPRITGAAQENEHSYASPMLYRDEEREFLITHGGDYVMAHSLNDGGELWRCCLNPHGATYHPTLRFVASPLAVPGMIVVPSAKGEAVLSLRPDARGDVSDDDRALHWRRAAGTPDVPSPLYHDGLVYLCRENGNLVCVDAKTGNKFYEERTTVDRHRASPLYADGKVYTTARNGIVTVVKAGREFEILAQNDLGEAISASPAVSDGRIYLRTFDALYAIGK